MAVDRNVRRQLLAMLDVIVGNAPEDDAVAERAEELALAKLARAELEADPAALAEQIREAAQDAVNVAVEE